MTATPAPLPPWPQALVEAAAAPYRRAGRFAWHFARGKLKGDPIFQALLQQSLIPDQARILDLGCGQGLLTAWLSAASAAYAAHQWPSDWPAPPQPRTIRGLDRCAHDVRRAHQAYGRQATFEHRDISTADFGHADVVVILDVLHMISYARQDDVLARARDALRASHDKLLLVRVADGDGGFGLRLGQGLDWLIAHLRGHGGGRAYCRPVAQWSQALQRLGFTVDTLPMSAGTPFANVLMVARLSAST
ncbi:MAG: class I SAM-dependent methyltransferase [Acidiferrobacter sp.]